MQFLNIEIDNLTFDEALERIDELLQMRAGGYVVTPNVDHIIQIEKNPEFRQAYQDAALVLTDGQPLMWISRWLNRPIKEKISGSDLFPQLCALAAEKGYTMYFLGAAEGVAAEASRRLEQKNPGLRVIGTYSPEYGFEKDPQKVEKVLAEIEKASPDILVAGLGTPKQELFLHKYRERLDGILAFGMGASLDFEAGNVRRAPRWMQKCGLEWLYRLCREPRRLFKRYLVDDMKIFPLVWKYRKQKKERLEST